MYLSVGFDLTVFDCDFRELVSTNYDKPSRIAVTDEYICLWNFTSITVYTWKFRKVFQRVKEDHNLYTAVFLNNSFLMSFDEAKVSETFVGFIDSPEIQTVPIDVGKIAANCNRSIIFNLSGGKVGCYNSFWKLIQFHCSCCVTEVVCHNTDPLMYAFYRFQCCDIEIYRSFSMIRCIPIPFRKVDIYSGASAVWWDYRFGITLKNGYKVYSAERSSQLTTIANLPERSVVVRPSAILTKFTLRELVISQIKRNRITVPETFPQHLIQEIE